MLCSYGRGGTGHRLSTRHLFKNSLGRAVSSRRIDKSFDSIHTKTRLNDCHTALIGHPSSQRNRLALSNVCPH